MLGSENGGKIMIPMIDYLGNTLEIGAYVVLFSKHGISFEGKIVWHDFNTDLDEDCPDVRRAVQVEDGMWIGGIGNHEILKIV